MPDEPKPSSSLRSHHIFIAAASLVLAAAGAGNAIFSARAGTPASPRPPAATADAPVAQAPSNGEAAPQPGNDAAPAPSSAADGLHEDGIVAARLSNLVAEATNAAQGSVNASGSADVNGTDPLSDAAAGAQAVARSAGLKTAVGGFWHVAWSKSWPFIRSMVVRFFGLLGNVWRSIVNAVTKNVTITVNGNVNGSVNSSVNAAATTNAAQ